MDNDYNFPVSSEFFRESLSRQGIDVSNVVVRDAIVKQAAANKPRGAGDDHFNIVLSWCRVTQMMKSEMV
jgi:hypothetical protein